MSFCPKTFAMAEDPKAKSVQKDARKSWRNWETNVKKWWGTFCRTFPKRKGSAPEDQKRSRNLRNLRETLVEPSQNLLAAQDEPLGSPRRICPREPETLRNLENLGGTFWQPKTDLAQRTRDTTKLGEAWWNLGGTFVKPWWNLGESLAEPWWNLGGTFCGTLVEPCAEPFGSPRRICPTKLGEPWWNLGESLAEPWWNMVEPSAEPFGSPRRILLREPETPRNLETLGRTLVEPWWILGRTLAEPSTEPWWNLARNLLAAQDGPAPENHRESESYSAPKPLLWLKTPKLLLLGKKDSGTIAMCLSKNSSLASEAKKRSHLPSWLLTLESNKEAFQCPSQSPGLRSPIGIPRRPFAPATRKQIQWCVSLFWIDKTWPRFFGYFKTTWLLSLW